MILFIKDVLPQGSSGHFARLALETGECLFAAEHNAPVAVHTQRRQGGIAFGTNVGRVHSREDWLPVQKRAANKFLTPSTMAMPAEWSRTSQESEQSRYSFVLTSFIKN